MAPKADPEAELEPVTVKIRGRFLPHLVSTAILSTLGFSYVQFDGPGYRKRLDDLGGQLQVAVSDGKLRDVRLSTVEDEIRALQTKIGDMDNSGTRGSAGQLSNLAKEVEYLRATTGQVENLRVDVARLEAKVDAISASMGVRPTGASP